MGAETTVGKGCGIVCVIGVGGVGRAAMGGDGLAGVLTIDDAGIFFGIGSGACCFGGSGGWIL